MNRRRSNPSRQKSTAQDSPGEQLETLQDFARFVDQFVRVLQRFGKPRLEHKDFFVSAVVHGIGSEWALDRVLIGTDTDADHFPDRGRIMTQRGDPKIFTRLDTLVRQLRDEFPGFSAVVVRVETL
jgi:hypothetical protein